MIMKSSNYKSLVAIFITAILIIIFYNNSKVDKENYYITINHLNKLKQIDGELYGNIFLTQFNKIKHYDMLRKNIDDLYKNSLILKQLNKDIKNSYFEYNLDKYFNALQAKEIYINRFISHIAVYKNFIDYYPKLSNDLSEKFQYKNEKLSKKILILQNAIVSLNYNNSVKYKKILKEIEDQQKLLEEEDKYELSYLLDYTKKLVETKHDMELLEKNLLSVDLKENINLLLKNYDDYYNDLEDKSKRYNSIIIFLVISLFVWIIYFIIHLNKANKKIKDTINELNFQKSALDQHAIVSIADRKGNITYVNEKFCKISSYSKEELLGKNHRMLKSDEHSKEFFETLWFTITNGKTWRGEVKNRKKDGTFYWVSATIVPFLDEFGKPFQYISIRTDITKIKEIEKDLIDAKIKADKSNAIKGQFLANMSHEIRTPLNAIIGFTKLLLDFNLQKKELHYISIIDKSAQNLLGIINDILDLSKIENGSLVYEKITFNPFLEFESVINLFMINANDKSISLVSFIDPIIPQEIIGDPLRIKQVLSNLISNAIKFTPKGGTIFSRIELISRDSISCTIRISIQDNGIGISQDKQKLIFEEFSQADDSTSREYGGTGLGLSISNKIIKALGSNIQVESEEGKGSKFFFDIELDTNGSADKHLLQFKKIDVAIVEPFAINPMQYSILKEYLESLCNVIEIQNSSDTDAIATQDIIFVDELSVDEKLISLESDTTTFVVLSRDKEKCDKFKNSIILNIPLNTSALFNILVRFVDNESFIDNSSKTKLNSFNGTVLIVEDHEINQQLIAALLDMREIKYTFANNGNEAIELFKKEEYDLILMDINMPEKNGLEAIIDIMNIEKEKNLDHTPIVALTANVIEADKQKIMDIGTDDYLYKPIDEKKLDEIFNKYLHKNSKKAMEVNVEYSLEDASKNMGLNGTIVKTIVANFCKTIDKDLESLEDAISGNDFKQIQNYSHKIKGAALNLRMEKVAKFAQNIEENSIKEKNQNIQENFINLKKAVKVVKESII